MKTEFDRLLLIDDDPISLTASQTEVCNLICMHIVKDFFDGVSFDTTYVDNILTMVDKSYTNGSSEIELNGQASIFLDVSIYGDELAIAFVRSIDYILERVKCWNLGYIVDAIQITTGQKHYAIIVELE